MGFFCYAQGMFKREDLLTRAGQWDTIERSMLA